MRRGVLIVTSLALLALASSPAARTAAQDQSPGPVSLTLRLAADHHQFRMGEIITVELVFSSPLSGRFIVDAATYDRSGRLTVDEFHIEPLEGVSDPLLDYFAASGGHIGGGLRGLGNLGNRPFIVHRELNEFLRFERAGIYTLSVRSFRVTDEETRTTTERGVIPVQSNTVTFEIVSATHSWQVEQFAKALEILDGPAASEADRRTGCRMLRFLATDMAVSEAIRRFDVAGGGCNFEYLATLFEAPNREYVVRRLEERLSAPDQPISARYLRTLSILSIYLRHPELRPAPSREHIGRIVAGELSRRADLLEATIEHYTPMLLAALGQKTGRARAFSLAELFDMASSARPAPAISEAQLKRQVAAAFLDLPPARQRTVLEHQWSRVADPAMLPALRRLAAIEEPSADDVFDLALRRLHALAPEEARPLILREIRHPRRGTTLATLRVLADRELPELDDALAANIEGDDLRELYVGLIERYATAAVASRILARADNRIGDMACSPQAALLAYFLRVDPQVGRMLLERAMISRRTTGCYRSALSDVARLRMAAAVETVAIVHLDDTEPAVVTDAAVTLGRFGSAAAYHPLRARLERWSQTWTGPDDELRQSLAQERPHAGEGLVESALIDALGRGQGWLADADVLRGLRALCVTDACRSHVDRLMDLAAGRRIQIFALDEPYGSRIVVAQYELRSLAALEAKLVQYSRGTSFTIELPRGLNPAIAASVAARLAAFAQSHGLALPSIDRIT